MTTRKPLHQVFELGSTEQSELGSNGPLSQQPVPSLDERANIYLRAVYGSQILRRNRSRSHAYWTRWPSRLPQKYRRACAIAISGSSRHGSIVRDDGAQSYCCLCICCFVRCGRLGFQRLASEKWSATDLRVALNSQTAQDMKTNLGLSSPSRIRLSPGAAAALRRR
jgi:hypothetical protein